MQWLQRVHNVWSVKPLRWAVGLVTVVGIMLVLFWAIRTDHGCNLTGFGPCDFVAGSDEDFRPEKTLWDWLGLLVIPAVLALGAYYFNRAERRNELQIAEQRVRTEYEIADDRLREEALQAYLDRMSDLLIEHGLRMSEPDTEVRSVARARTLTVFRRLDGGRRAAVVQFLYESNLVTSDEPVVALFQADLMNVDLESANLRGANLRGTNLEGAVLHRAKVTQKQLDQTKSLEGAVGP